MNSPTKRALKPRKEPKSRPRPLAINEQPNQKGTETHKAVVVEFNDTLPSMNSPTKRALKHLLACHQNGGRKSINEQPNQKGTETAYGTLVLEMPTTTINEQPNQKGTET